MITDADSIPDFGPKPTPLDEEASSASIIRVVNILTTAEYEARVTRHKHRIHMNRAITEVRDDLADVVDKITIRLDASALSQSRVERALLGDEYGTRGMVHRVEAIERASKGDGSGMVDVSLFGKAKTVAAEWCVKIGVIIVILIVLDYGSKAAGLWKAGVTP